MVNFQIKKNEILTRYHVLEHLRKRGKIRQDELAEELMHYPIKVHSVLKKLMAVNWVKRQKIKYIEGHRKHTTYYYYLTKEAERWRTSNGMYTYLDSRNPALPKLQKMARAFSELRRHKVGGRHIVVPRKELRGFR